MNITILLAHTLINNTITQYPELATPANMSHNINTMTLSDRPAERTSHFTLLFNKLCTEVASWEQDLTEFGNFLEPAASHGHLVTLSDDHTNIIRYVCGIINDNKTPLYYITAHAPLVHDLIATNSQRPLTNNIRICCYLISFYSSLVRLDRDFLRPLSEVISMTRSLIPDPCTISSNSTTDGRKNSNHKCRNPHTCTSPTSPNSHHPSETTSQKETTK